MISRLIPILLVSGVMAGCGEGREAAPVRHGHYPTPQRAGLPPEALPGGATSHVSLIPGTARSADAFSQPAANLDAAGRARFAVGNSFFTSPWVSAPASVAARDGLGPLFSAAACQDCHIRDGRGHPPAGPDDPLQAAVLRLARPDGQVDPVYGGQLQPLALPGHAPEARLRVSWHSWQEVLPGGQRIDLRRPRLQLDRWGYGPHDPQLRGGLRIGPPMIGLGLLERIPEQAILAQAAAQASGLSGRANRVRRLADGELVVGRFGWKAAQPTVRQQVLQAFAEDIGITSSLNPRDACTQAQQACREAPAGGEPELEAAIEEAVVFYSRHLAPPARRDHERPDVRKGERLFQAIGCAACHRPRWQTAGEGPLAAQAIYPYTDLLLHDMGEGLAGSGSEEGLAGPREWRTAPLWGLGHTHSVAGARAGFLHDGRAADLAAAIWWHGGEAQAARDRWLALAPADRRRVIRFLASL